MKLSIKNTLRIALLTTTVRINRIANTVVEASGRGVTRAAQAIVRGVDKLNNKTFYALDRRLDKAYDIRIEEIARINREAEQSVARMQEAIDNMPYTVRAKLEGVRKATTV